MFRLSTIVSGVLLVLLATATERLGYAEWEEIGQIIIVATLLVLVFQVAQERKSRSFEVFRNLLKDYSDIIAEEGTAPELSDIWLPIDADRRASLDQAQAGARIGAWQAMTEHERRQYWRTRRVFDIFEMAFMARRDLWLNKSLWQRWENLIKVWCGTRYFEYVFDDASEKYSDEFRKYVEKQSDHRINPTQSRD